MSDVYFYLTYALVTLLFYIPSLLARFRWSGSGFSKLKFFGVLVYNILFVYVHMKYVKYGYLPFFGEREDPVLGWVSFVMIFLYMFSMPVTWERKRITLRNKKI
ncbi:hypothetical protein [Pseudomonas yamanorum]|uniref:hypothetical protein n=1 Tax=Pseudomonas yamanorum TaxID=515393 RepID=UPI003BA02750